MHTGWQPYICLRGLSGLFSSQLPFPFLHPPLTFRTCQETATQSLYAVCLPPAVCQLNYRTVWALIIDMELVSNQNGTWTRLITMTYAAYSVRCTVNGVYLGCCAARKKYCPPALSSIQSIIVPMARANHQLRSKY